MYFAMITEKKKNEIEIELQEGVDQIRFSWQHLDVFANLFVSGEVCDLSGFEPKKKKNIDRIPENVNEKEKKMERRSCPCLEICRCVSCQLSTLEDEREKQKEKLDAQSPAFPLLRVNREQ